MVLALVMVFGMIPANAIEVFAAEVGDTTTTKTETAPTDVEYGIWQLTNTETVCGTLAHTHGDGCSYLGCAHYQRTLTGQPLHDKDSCYGDSTTSWEVCPGGDHAHTATESGASVYANSELKALWQPIYDAAAAEYRANNAKPSGWAGLGYEAQVIAYATEAVQNTTFCYTIDAPLTCGHGDSCTDACCALTEHTHTEEAGCYEYTWTLMTDENNNNIVDGTTEDPYYTITFKHDDGVSEDKKYEVVAFNVVDEETGEKKDVLYAPEYTPSRNGYTFEGWIPALTETLDVKDHEFTAGWKAIPYEIKFVNADGTVLQSGEVDYGTTPVYTGETPAKESTVGTDYKFAGWSPEITTVTGEATYTATYTESVRKYTVTFVDGDGKVLQSGEVEYGTKPVYNGETPTKSSTNTKNFTFQGWDNEIAAVTGPATYTAQFDASTRYYKVTFKDYDGTVLGTSTVEYENAATAPTNPTRAADETYTYTFAGWDTEFDAITADNVVVTAQYDASYIDYEIKWTVNGVTNTQELHYGDAIVAPKNPEMWTDGDKNYYFLGWDVDGDKTISQNEQIPATVTDDAEFTAVFSTKDLYEVTVNYGDDLGNKISKCESGTEFDLDALATTRTGYTFDGWYINGAKVSGKITITANTYIVAKWSVNSYTITFVTDGGTTIDPITAAYGAAVTAPADPTKEGYTFTGWDKAIPAIMPAGDLVITASWEINQYTITFVTDGGTTIDPITADYGTALTAPDAPEKEGYTFKGWDQEIPATMPAENVTFTAQWEINKYTINWVVDGETTPETYEHGQTPEYKGSTDKATVDYVEYTFTGWNPAVAEAVADATYTAQHTAKLLASDGELELNKSVSDAAEHLKGLKSNVLNAAGITDGHDGFTVTTVYSITVWGNSINVTLNITNESIDEILPSGLEWAASLVDGAALLASDLTSKTEKAFTISNNSGLSADVTHKITEARKPATVSDLTVKDFGSFNEQSEFETVVKDAIRGTYNDGAGNIDPEFNLLGTDATAEFTWVKTETVNDKTVHTYNVTVQIKDGSDWLASDAKTFEGLTWTVNQYEILWIDGNGDTLKTDLLDFGAMPKYTGETPTKEQTVATTYTFDGWNEEIVAVAGKASYTAKFTEADRIYKIHWDTDGDGSVDTSTEAAYGNMPEAPDYVAIENKSFAGWSPAIAEVSGETTYTATYSDDTIYSVTFMVAGVVYGEVQYINVTKNPTAVVADPGNPDANNDYAFKIFDGWDVDIVGQIPTGNTVVNAIWVTDVFNNNVRDEDEMVTIHTNVVGNGTILIEGGAELDGQYVYDSTGTTMPNGNTLTIKVTVSDADGSDGSAEYVDSITGGAVATTTPGVYTLIVEDGGVYNVTATVKAHSISAVENPAIVVNGEDADSKLEDVTKEAVLKAVLGVDTVDVSQYDVKVMVNAAGYNGYYDIWVLIDSLEAELDKGNDFLGMTSAALSALKGAFNQAIDVGGSETFEITWLAHDKYPEVKGEYDVNLVESRTPTTVEHNGNTYTATALTDALLEQIKDDLTSNTTIIGMAWTDSTLTLQPGTEVETQVTVTVQETDLLFGKTHEIIVKLIVPTDDIDVKIPETADVTFNTGMSGTDKVALLKEKVPYTCYVIGTDILAEDVEEKSFVVKYKASEARDVPYTINVDQLDLGLAGQFLPATIEVQIPVGELWLDMTTKGNDFPAVEAPSNELIREIVLNDLIPNYADDYLAGDLSTEQLKNIAAELLANHPDVANYYKYMGAHQFGEMESETIYYIIDTQFGLKETNKCVLDMEDTRPETTILLNEGITVTYNGYTEAELLAKLVKGVQSADGNMVEGAVVTFVTDVEGLPASEASSIVVEFAGNEKYRPSKASGVITINKATVDVAVDNRLVKFGTAYAMPVVTNPAGIDTINFIGGINVEGVNVDNGLKGFVAQIQLLLPEELQALLSTADVLLQNAGLNVSFANGASMKLSELQASVDALDELFAGTEYEEYFNILLNMLQSLPTDIGDIEIIVGGDMPTDIGAYVIGAVSADANYTTDFGVGALVIYPDGTKVDLAWNQNSDNYIVTRTLLKTKDADGKYLFDTAATAYERDTDYAVVDQAATAQIAELFLGVDVDGSIIIEMDQTKLNVGAYVEVAMTVEWGNTMYYSEPIIRPVVVVAESLNVDFVDHTGAVNGERHFVFDNTAHSEMEKLHVTYKQDGNGYTAGTEIKDYDVTYYYVGVQTNGVPYASKTAPVHAGAYTVTAVVILRDAAGEISHAGVGVGVLAIEPATSDITVENKAVPYVSGKSYGTTDMVKATSAVMGLTPDSTVITAGITTDQTFGVNGLKAITGTVNVDMPSWLDEIFTKYDILAAGYTADGITVENLMGYVQKIQNILIDLDVDTAAFDGIVDVVEQLPANTRLTFFDNASYSTVGAYLVIGVVTDSDHYPSVAAGVLVIYPEVTEVELKFEEDWNGNNIFTWKALQNINLDAQAYDLGTDNVNEAATEKVTNIYLGFDDNGKIVLTNDKATLDNGAYTQLAVLLDMGSEMYYADPITRAFLIVPNPATVEFIDANGNVNHERLFTFDNKQHGMDVRVTVDGKVVEDPGVTVTYVGAQTNLETYKSNEAPVHTGVYAVTATYTVKDAQDRLVTLGAAAGTLIIGPAKSGIEVSDKVQVFDGAAVPVTDMVKATSAVEGITPNVTIISAAINTDGTFSENLTGAITGSINIDLPVWVDAYIAKSGRLADGVTVAGALAEIEKLEAELGEIGEELRVLSALSTVLKQLPADAVLSFNSDVSYNAVGAYLIVGIVTDSNHCPSVDAGFLAIYPSVEFGELAWKNADSNHIFYLDSLADGYLDAKYIGNETVDPTELYLGVDADNWLIHLSKAQPDSVGIYTELAYLNDTDSDAHYAMPIIRPVVVVDGIYDVLFHDENGNVNHNRLFTYNGEAQPIGDIYVYGYGKGFYSDNVPAEDSLEIRYIGTDVTGDGWLRSTPPTDAGAYTVIAIYTDYDENGAVIGGGAGMGAMVIRKADLALDMVDTTVAYDGNEHFINVTSNDETADYLTVIIDKEANVINFVLEDDLTIAGGVMKVLLESALGRELDGSFSVTEVQQAIHKIIDSIQNYQLPEEVATIAAKLPVDLQNALNELKSTTYDVVKAELDAALETLQSEIPQSGTVVFNGELPVNAGSYQFYGFAVSENYEPEATKGILNIEKAIVEVPEVASKVYTGEKQIADVAENALYAVAENKGGVDAGQYVVILKLTDSKNYKWSDSDDADKTLAFEITKATNVWTVEPGIKGWTCGEEPNAPVAEAKYGEVKVEYRSAAGSDFTAKIPSAAGEYVVRFTVEENNNYTGLIAEVKLIIAADNSRDGLYPIYMDADYETVYEGAMIYVDGVGYELDNDVIAYVPTDSATFVTTYVYNTQSGNPHDEFPTHMYVWQLIFQGDKDGEWVDGECYIAERVEEFDDIMQYSGCSIRMKGKKGIRMITSIPTNARNTLIKSDLAGWRLMQTGTCVEWADENGEVFNSLTLETNPKLTGYAYKRGEQDPVFNRTAKLTQFTNVLVGFSDEQCVDDLVMRPYMILENVQTGEQAVLYGGAVQRSIGYIAYRNRFYKPNRAAYDFIWSIIHNVYGDEYDADYKA